MTHPRTAAVIVAAGRGERLGGSTPKQFLPLAGRAVVAHSVAALRTHPEVDEVVVVIGEGQAEALTSAAEELRWVIGGATRRESVRAGLAAVKGAERVLIHDAARPLLPHAVIDRLLAALETAPGAIPVMPVADTIVRDDGEAVPRADLHRVQTPQAFNYGAITAAHDAWDEAYEATDDAQVLRAAGARVALVEGSALLEKITTADDLAAAEARIGMVSRSATGFDVHRLEAGEELWLGGVLIPYDKGLSGHSDADVALHAITDALLGTIGAGDIGTHFPPSDPKWRGAESGQFLQHAVALIGAEGGVVDFVDVTLICEAPKIGPHRAAIRTRIAALCGLPERSVSVKATTTERLGFTGRGEGIAAQAIATVRLPGVRV